MHFLEYIATKPFSEELFRNDVTTSDVADFAKIFQSMLHFYSAINMPKSNIKVESEVSMDRYNII